MTFPTLSEGSRWSATFHNTFVKSNFEANPPHMLTTAGDIPVATAAGVIGRLGIGTNGQILESRASEATGRKWVNSGLVPVGGIVIWSGALASIPSGWQICDGTNGTPNLRDRFVVGSGTSYAIGDTGGAASANLQHSHTLTSPTATNPTHTHTQAATNSSGAHSHSITTTSANTDSPANNTTGAGTTMSSYGHSHTVSGSTSSDGAHTHTNPDFAGGGSHSHAITTATTSTGLSTTQTLLPAYLALCYIMRIS